jgi:hypothetical protein
MMCRDLEMSCPSDTIKESVIDSVFRGTVARMADLGMLLTA